MRFRLLSMLAALSLSLTACGGIDTATRNLTTSDSFPASAYQRQDYNVRNIQVRFAPDMSVSEANMYFPIADIVWRGDPRGDRKAQIKAIFDDAMARGTRQMNGSIPVVLDIVVTRFHSLTEKTRYAMGGTHTIRFDLTVRNAQTGAVLEGPRPINADFPGLGGDDALRAEAMGQTQKVRILDRLAQVIAAELSPPAAAQPNVEQLAALQ